MTQVTINAQETETSSHHNETRFVELAGQSWDRNKCADLAQTEGISLNDEHLAVIIYLRKHYRSHMGKGNYWNEASSPLGCGLSPPSIPSAI